MDKWIVWDWDNGIVLTTSNYEDAVKTYECYKQETIDWVMEQREFGGTERVILAKIDKNFYSRFVKFNKDKEEVWEFAEDTDSHSTSFGKSNIFGYKNNNM